MQCFLDLLIYSYLIFSGLESLSWRVKKNDADKKLQSKLKFCETPKNLWSKWSKEKVWVEKLDLCFFKDMLLLVTLKIRFSLKINELSRVILNFYLEKKFYLREFFFSPFNQIRFFLLTFLNTRIFNFRARMICHQQQTFCRAILSSWFCLAM